MLNTYNDKDKRVPVNIAQRVLRVRIEERRPVWREAEKIFNKQSRQGVVLQIGGLAEVLTTPLRKT